MKSKRTVVFFDVEIGRKKVGRIKMQLWNDRLPHTCQNFRQLCTGEHLVNGKPTGYKQTCFFELFEGEIRGGDFIKNDGSSGKSIYDEPFSEQSEYTVHQDTSWILAMVKNVQTKKYSSVFQINRQWKQIDEKQLAPFGEINDEPSLKTLKTLMAVPTVQAGNKKPRMPIIINQCGEM